MPAIYEHKACFIKDTPSRVCRDAELFTKAVLTEYELVQPDALVIGMDVYNVEAEAAGSEVTYFDEDARGIPGITPGGHAIRSYEDLSKRLVPNPLADGRMPENIKVARRVVREVGDEAWVRGALSGPFSLAVSLAGAEAVFASLLENPSFVRQLLEYSGRIIQEFGKAYIDVGADVIIFDSLASPDLLSPDHYQELVRPVSAKLIAFFKNYGVRDIPLIVGGNTSSISDALICTGANNLLCDFNCEWGGWLEKCRANHVAIRRNLDPLFIQKESPEAVFEAANSLIREAEDFRGFILGTAVVPYGTPLENLRAVREACRA